MSDSSLTGLPLDQLSNPVYVGQFSTFEAALSAWVAEQVSCYPHKQELINIVSLAMKDFLLSHHVVDHKLTVINVSRSE